jgi:two-component system OmpR family sensor kinase
MVNFFRRTPLRLKLVAALMALVTVALLVIGLSSVLVMRSYLRGRTDRDLRDFATTVNNAGVVNRTSGRITLQVQLPSNFFAADVGSGGVAFTKYDDTHYEQADLPNPPRTADEASGQVNHFYTSTSSNGQTRWRVLVTSDAANPGYYLVFAKDMSDVDDAITRLFLAELLVGAGVVVLLAVVGAAVVRASLRPLREIENTAAAIAQGDLARRVPEYEPGYEEPRTEVGHLARSLNTMLGQIEAAFTARAQSEARAWHSEERMRQFVADASHELRTPLTTIRGFAELYRQGAFASPADAQRLVRRIEDEAARMGLLVEDLLLLARLDAARPLAMTPLELRVIGSDAVIAAQAVAPDRPIKLDIPEGTGPLVVNGDEARLRQVVGNLMTNALVHTPAGTPVTLRLRGEPGLAVIEVADRGPGLAPEQVNRVFERFYRADVARTRRSGDGSGDAGSGTGLGLAIVAALVVAHGGVVEVETLPGQGATFRVRLPLAAGAPTDIEPPEDVPSDAIPGDVTANDGWPHNGARYEANGGVPDGGLNGSSAPMPVDGDGGGAVGGAEGASIPSQLPGRIQD